MKFLFKPIATLIICLLTNSLIAQNQDLIFDNDTFIYFKDNTGANDGVRIGRHTGNSIRLRYSKNTLVFDALDDRPVEIRNSSNIGNIRFHPAGTSFFKVGNLGIGTDNPSVKLEVVSDGVANSAIKAKNGGLAIVGGNSTKHSIRFDDISGIDRHLIYVDASNDVIIGNSNFDDLIFNGQKIGIGISSPDEMLEVNGTIRSKEVKVEASPWPDYVFEEDYNLRSLEETEAYIQKNKHLPEIPSAEEMEANGVQLGEMNRLLLKKIEELTLYTIELNKENTTLRQQQVAIKQNQSEKLEQLTLLMIVLKKEIETLKEH